MKLHSILLQYKDSLLQNDPPNPIPLGNNQSAFVYGSGEKSLIFLINQDDKNAATVSFQKQQYTIPAWSATILGGNKVLFNTATLEKSYPSPATIEPKSKANLFFSWYPEPIGTWGNTTQIFDHPHELISLTHDRTDYLWYVRTLPVMQDNSLLSFTNVVDYAHVFIDGVYKGSGSNNFNIVVNKGYSQLQVLVMTIGLINFGEHMFVKKKKNFKFNRN